MVGVVSHVSGVTHADVTDFAFGPPEVIELPEDSSATCIALRDLDGDGDIDGVVSGRNTDGRVVVLEGSPGGQMSVVGELTAPDQTDWAVLEDLDDDGDFDLVLAIRDQGGEVVIFDGTPDGGFEEKPRSFRFGREVRSVQVAKMNGDDTWDLAVLGHTSEDVTILLGDGTGHFEPSFQTRLSPWKNGYVYPQSCSLVDLNGDDQLDLATISTGAGGIGFLTGSGDGSFLGERLWDAPLVNNQSGGCAYGSHADFDNDGLLEFILPQTTWGQQWCVVFEVDAQGNVNDKHVFPGSPFGLSWISAEADFDGDGDVDLVTGHALPGVISFLENSGVDQGRTVFLESQWFMAGEFIRYLTAIDIDNDGDQDLVAVDFSGDQVFIFRNGMNQGFMPSAEVRNEKDRDQYESIRKLDGPNLVQWLSEVSVDAFRSVARSGEHETGPKPGQGEEQ